MDGGAEAASWWELTVECDERVFPAAVARLKRHGLRTCVVDRRDAARVVLRIFLPHETPRARLLGLAQQLIADAERLEGRPTQVRYRRAPFPDAPSFPPTRVGRRLVVQPAAAELPRDGRLAVRLLPRAAFGSIHPTTRLCLEALEERELRGAHLIDLGCGSGVLGIAALLLGARSVVAVDDDAVAVDAARGNAKLNGVDLRVERGSVERLLEHTARSPLDGLLCNTLASLLEEVIPLLRGRASWAILSGIRDGQRERIEAACAAERWTISRWRQSEGWALAELGQGGKCDESASGQ